MIIKNWGFCDLSISSNFDLTKLLTLEKLGFKTIAINTYVEECEEPKKKKKKGENKEKKDYVPDPVEIPEEIAKSCNLNILQRVTIEFSDPGIVHKLNQSDNLKKYDLVAVVPKSLYAFQYACGSMNIDVISYEPEGKIPFKVSRKAYIQAVERGLFFELMYSPAIRDPTSRRNMISTSHLYYAVGKSKNIILTSGAENEMQVRHVNDVLHLGFIFGLNSNESLGVVRDNARRLLLKAERRKRGKHFMIIDTEDENETPEN